jgi:ribosomal protein S18 acetylase RimI-like enzyme
MIARTDIVRSTTDREQAVRTLTSAFRSDPVCRWVWPEKDRFERYFPPFIGAFAGGAFDNDSAHVTEGAGGVALWLPPGVTSDEEGLGALAQESIDPSAQDEVFAFLGMQAGVHPHEPHWYLPLIGVHPEQQGRGLGSVLLEHALRVIDGQGLPAYLEATTERNRALYERYGFRVTGEIQYGSSPTMWPMYRKSR